MHFKADLWMQLAEYNVKYPGEHLLAANMLTLWQADYCSERYMSRNADLPRMLLGFNLQHPCRMASHQILQLDAGTLDGKMFKDLAKCSCP